MTGGILQGLRVVDLTTVVVGPLTTMVLADYGAEVIKVEPPAGDLLRTLGGASRSEQLSPKFLHFNRNKRSLSLDLKHPVGAEALRRLLRTADVCVSNMRPDAMARLGLTPEALRELNPSMIYCGLVGFGRGGRYSGKPAYDSIIQGVGGMSGAFQKSTGEPRFVPMTIADHSVGLIAVQMILLALYRRRDTGVVEHIEVPMFENMAAMVLSEHMGQLSYVPPRGQAGDKRVLEPLAQPIPTRDGHICISANTNAQAFALFEAIGRPELRDDPRFCSTKARYKHVAAYFALRNEALLEKTTAEWLEIFDRLDVPAGPSHTLESLMEDPHLADVGLFRKVPHPDEGDIIDIALPNTVPGGARSDYSAPPVQGQHSREILAELGYENAEIQSLIEGGLVIDAGPVREASTEPQKQELKR